MISTLLTGEDRKLAQKRIIDDHYTHSVPSGKSYYFAADTAIVVFSVPANMNIARWLLGEKLPVWDMSRLWAPDGHPPNLLTAAISASIRALREVQPGIAALVSYADPNSGHLGGVYRAASWLYLGQCEDTRFYLKDGQRYPRRKFHSGHDFTRKQGILALGYEEVRLPGKYRFGKGLTPGMRRRIERRHLDGGSRRPAGAGL